MSNKISDYIIKHSEKKNENLKYDFMPNILEIIEKPANKAGSTIILSIFIMVIVVVVWASIAKTDIVVSANGSILPEGDVRTVQSFMAGDIDEIYVREGQLVEKGDTLIKLNSETDADIEQINNQIGILKVEMDVYSRILKNEDISKITTTDYKDIYASYVETIVETQNNYLTTRQSLKLAVNSAKLDYDSAVLTKNSYADKEAYKTQYETQSKVVEQKKLQKDDAELKLKSYDAEHMQQLNNNYSEKNTQLLSLQSQLEKYNNTEIDSKITAPIDGYVDNMIVNTSGTSVSAYEKLMTIIPSNVPLRMNCYIQNKDIADISINDPVEVKLDAYSYSDYGTVKGKIIYISPNSTVVENVGNVYQVIAEINNTNEKINIKSGLTGSMEIKIGERTIIKYFLDPIINGIDDSLKEK